MIFETGKTPLDLAVADFTQDKILDIVTVNRNDNSLTIFIGIGDGSFYDGTHVDMRDGSTWIPSVGELSKTGARRESGDGPTSVAAGDLNRDGLIDLVVTQCFNFCHRGGFTLFYGDGQGRFKHAGYTEHGVSPYNVTLVDLNQDQYLDIVSSDLPGNQLIAWLSDGQGGYHNPSLKLKTGKKPIAVQAADVDQNGWLDLVSSNFGEGTASIFLAKGNGDFELPVTYPLGRLPYSIALEDFSGDQIPDLVVAHSSRQGSLAIHRGDGKGSFMPSEEFSTGRRLVYIESSDIDHDGNRDLIATTTEAKYAVIFFGRGDGTFDAEDVKIPSENQVYSMKAADFNGDGTQDLASIDFKKSSLFIALGKAR